MFRKEREEQQLAEIRYKMAQLRVSQAEMKVLHIKLRKEQGLCVSGVHKITDGCDCLPT